MIRKTTAVVAATALLATLAACGSDSNDSKATPAASETPAARTEPVRIGVVGSQDDQWPIFEKKAEEAAAKIGSGELTLEDFLEQMLMIRKMGPIGNLLGMLPGAGQMKEALAAVDDSHLDRIQAIIRGMTEIRSITSRDMTSASVMVACEVAAPPYCMWNWSGA